MSSGFADIILPVAVAGSYTYGIPSGLHDQIQRGTLVTVPFRTEQELHGTGYQYP